MSSLVQSARRITAELAGAQKHPDRAVRTRLLLGTVGLLGLRIAFGGLSFLVTLVLSRILGAEGYGVYSYAFAWAVLLGVPAVLGMDQLLVREVAAYRIKSQWQLMSGLVRMGNRVGLMASSILVLLAATTSFAFRARLGTQMVATFWIALLLLPLITLTRIRQSILQGLHHVVLGAVPERLIQPALLLSLVVAGRWSLRALTAPVAMGMNVFATSLALVIGIVFLYRKLPAQVKQAEPSYESRVWAKSAWPILVLSGIGVLLSQSGTLILGALKGPGAVGLYSVSVQGAEFLTFILITQRDAFPSTVASLYAAGNLAELQRLVTKVTRWIFVATLPLAVLFIGFGRWVLLYMYGPQFVPARTAFAILSFGQLVNIGMGLNGMLLVMTGYESTAAKAIGAGAAANIILSSLLVPKWGLEGAAISSASSIIFWNILATVSLWRKTGIHSTGLGAFQFRRS
jgi:O-antigen/teichoic acid export membrane protein